jgi:hypothetical protein
MRPLLPALAGLLIGCHANPGLDEEKLGETGLEDTARPSLAERVVMSFSVALQRGDWGESLTRCQVELAFLERGQHDGLFNSPSGQVIDYPTTPGTCRYTSFTESEAALGLWSIKGTRQAGQSVWLHGDEASLELELGIDDRGRYTYALNDCDEAAFPFAQVLDLEVPGDDGEDGLAGFEAPEAFAVGADIAIDALPLPLDERGRLVLPAGEDLRVGWSYLQQQPSIDGQAVEHLPYLMLRNMHPGDEQPFEALACLPSQLGTATIGAADLAQLTPAGDPETGDPYVAFQLDAWYEGPAVQTPWRSSSRVLSMVTEGGILILEP